MTIEVVTTTTNTNVLNTYDPEDHTIFSDKQVAVLYVQRTIYKLFKFLCIKYSYISHILIPVMNIINDQGKLW